MGEKHSGLREALFSLLTPHSNGHLPLLNIVISATLKIETLNFVVGIFLNVSTLGLGISLYTQKRVNFLPGPFSSPLLASWYEFANGF